MFKRQQDAAANAQCVVEGFQPRRELFPFRVPEIARHAAERQHEVVVGQRVFFEEDFFLREIEIHHGVEQHRDAGPVGEDGADGLRDFRRRESGGGHLIQQRLEEVMILPVNQRDARPWMVEGLAKGQSTEARPQNHDVFGFHAALTFNVTGGKANS